VAAAVVAASVEAAVLPPAPVVAAAVVAASVEAAVVPPAAVDAAVVDAGVAVVDASVAAVTVWPPSDFNAPLSTFATRVDAELLGIVAVMTTLPAATVSVISLAVQPAEAAISVFISSCTVEL
jgi:hypothetical protein